MLRDEPRPVQKTVLATASMPEIAMPKPPASPMVQPSEADSACPNLARVVPLTEPRYNQGQVAAVQSAETSANTTRRSLAETGGSIDAKYQYQIHATLRSKVPQFRNGQEVHIAAVIPPDLRVQPGDIVAWDGAYRDVPGTCHLVPARIRAVLGHAELPSAPARSEVPASPAAPPAPSS
ncbi:hypothetical protein ASC92_26535 [Variovorax sp. Root411]|nr:hypothetical protein ASC92_26535 [Variovorax sp. Root411]